MIRLLGFLLGSAAAAALLAAWVSWNGRPDLAALVPAGVERLRNAAQALPTSPADAPVASPAETGRSVPEPPGGPVEDPSEPATVGPDAPPPAEVPVADNGTPEPAAGPSAGDTVAMAAVWRPFRSERAARGFASHLAERYGAAAGVRRDGPGRYRVTVSAEDEPSLSAEIERLRVATGIEGLEAGP